MAIDCGVAVLNQYLQHFANQDQKHDLTRIYVLAERRQIIGYYSICAHAAPTHALPDSNKISAYHNAPFLLLGRLAVDKRHQGQGYGDALIFHAFKITQETAEKVGVLGMIVDAKDEKAAGFYEKFGFTRLSGAAHRLMRPFSVMFYNNNTGG
ncbi:MAG: N-acetyltransferase [Methylococcaceae bacterium]|nr:MAG: N-acetyltransferase [Methylococcaceae bacterium]